MDQDVKRRFDEIDEKLTAILNQLEYQEDHVSGVREKLDAIIGILHSQ